MSEMKNSMSSAFVGLVTGAKSLKESIVDLLSKFAEMLASRAFDMLWSGLGGGGMAKGLLGMLGFANGTPSAPGGLAMVGERGPELVNLPRGSSVYPAGQTSRMMGGQNQQVSIVLHAPEGFTAEQMNQIQGVSVRVAETSIASNNRTQSDQRYLRGG